MKPTTYAELAAKGDTTTMLTPLYIDDVLTAAREWAANHKGHGHVIPRKDGHLARCGGPSLCRECQLEAAVLVVMKGQ